MPGLCEDQPMMLVYVKVGTLVGKTWDPETWAGHPGGSPEGMALKTPVPSELAEGPLLPLEASTSSVLEDAPGASPTKAAGVLTRGCPTLSRLPAVTREKVQGNLDGDLLGLVREKRGCMSRSCTRQPGRACRSQGAAPVLDFQGALSRGTEELLRWRQLLGT